MSSRRAAPGAHVLLSALALATALVACGGDGDLTELVVVVDTDIAVPAGIDEIALDVQGPSGMQYPVVAALGTADAPELPLYTFLEPAGNVLEPVTITARGRLAGADVVSQVVRTQFIRGESRTVFMMLSVQCTGVACDAEESCRDGICAPIDVASESLPPWTGSPTRPDGGVDGGDGGLDGGDGGDGGVDACVPAAETCNGVDDDCDEAVDEDFDLTSDPSNCGACGVTCDERAHASVSCEAGSCVSTCDSGFADCDDDEASGCEADLSAPATCGACAVSCDASAPLCDSTLGCVADCGAGTTLCGTACANLGTDTNNCGSCGTMCPDVPRSTPACGGGSCSLSCDSGYDDCNMNPADGCEARLNTVTNCGLCGSTCSVANASADCSTGACRIGSCNSGYADCDGNAANGCEALRVPLYADNDGDGYGNPASAVPAGCPMPASGIVDNGADCDDTDALINPAGTEICNGRDDDCDMTVDGGLFGCGETCATPMIVRRSTMFEEVRHCAGSDEADPPCDVNSEPEQVYQLELSVPATVNYDLASVIGGDINVWIDDRMCGGERAIYCDDRASSGSLNLPAGTYFLYVEVDGSCRGRYDLNLEIL